MYNQYNQFTPVPQPDYSQMSLRQELEARFAQMEAEEQKKKLQQSLSPQPDYSNMSLRQELEARFAELEKQEQNARQTPVPNNYPQMLPPTGAFRLG